MSTRRIGRTMITHMKDLYLYPIPRSLMLLLGTVLGASPVVR